MRKSVCSCSPQVPPIRLRSKNDEILEKNPKAAEKRKSETAVSTADAKLYKKGGGSADDDETVDLIVLGLPYDTSEEEMRKYFQDFGKMLLCSIKFKSNGKSKG